MGSEVVVSWKVGVLKAVKNCIIMRFLIAFFWLYAKKVVPLSAEHAW